MKNLLSFLFVFLALSLSAGQLSDLKAERARLSSCTRYVWAKVDNKTTAVDRRAKTVFVNRCFVFSPPPSLRHRSKWQSRYNKALSEWQSACSEVLETQKRDSRIKEIDFEISRLSSSR